MKSGIAGAFCAAALVGITCAQEFAPVRVHGTLSYASGVPADKFLVRLEPIHPNQSRTQQVLTDEHGAYSFADIVRGEYVLYPYDNSPGYPIRHDMFMTSTPDRLVVPDNDVSDIVKDLVLAPAAAIVEGRVVGPSGSAVGGSEVVLCHSAETWRSAELRSDREGRFKCQVPSGESLSILVSDHLWGTVQLNNISFRAGENTELVVKLGGKGSRGRVPNIEACKPYRP